MLYEMLFPHKASKLNEILPRKFEPRPPSEPKASNSRLNLAGRIDFGLEELLDPNVNLIAD
jgi:hypothetical protein